jgi:rSAM/selenodomain-associated transferase 1
VPANLIILFAKAPVVGQVKTRLVPAITPEFAAQLHTAFVRDMIERFRAFEGADFEVHTDRRSDAWRTPIVTRKLQTSGNLGLKMIHALQVGLESGYQRVVIVGSDAPTLPAAHIATLLSADADVAFGPADDGGFYAIAARRVDPGMFDGVVWSTPDTLARSMAAAERRGLSVASGPQWFDVDDPEDLDRLMRQSGLPFHTAACLESIRAEQPDIYRCAESAD